MPNTTPHWLFIFDNADHPKQLEPHLPTGSGHLAQPRPELSAEPPEGGVLTRGESGSRPAAPRARTGYRGCAARC